MKKYLLMGFVALAFTACVSDKEVTPQTQGEKYEKAFEQLIGGAVNANVNWGFDAQQVATFDADGKYTGMRGVDANGNEWGLYVDVPQPLTEAQKDKVTRWFKAHNNPEGVAINWSDFFVQQVFEGEWGPNMNYLYCGSDVDHTFNFNAGNAGVYQNVCYGLQEGATDQNQRVYGSDKIEFMVNSSTEYFGFHNSFDSNFYKDNYVIIPGDVIQEWENTTTANGENADVSGMFFVGFDFEAHGVDANTQQVDRDYYFDNWIVKITPGLYKNRERIMVEDLIASDLSQVGYSEGKSDWDFNDAVFDVAYLRQQDANYQMHDYAVITLWAAGGTKSLTVAGKEVHELFGQPVSKMINTKAPNGIDGLQPVIFRIDMGAADYNKQYDANEVKVFVGGTELKAEVGKAPQKVKVSKTTRWMKELLIITSGYAQFATYATTGQPTNWYETVTDASVLY
jgi:hypothetical protein